MLGLLLLTSTLAFNPSTHLEAIRPYCETDLMVEVPPEAAPTLDRPYAPPELAVSMRVTPVSVTIDGDVVGTTPLEAELPRSEEPQVFELRPPASARNSL